mgnify:CR=1 FL=1
MEELRQLRLPRPRRLALDVLWFLLVGGGIGFFLGHPFIGALAGAIAWRVRREVGSHDS